MSLLTLLMDLNLGQNANGVNTAPKWISLWGRITFGVRQAEDVHPPLDYISENVLLAPTKADGAINRGRAGQHSGPA